MSLQRRDVLQNVYASFVLRKTFGSMLQQLA